MNIRLINHGFLPGILALGLSASVPAETWARTSAEGTEASRLNIEGLNKNLKAAVDEFLTLSRVFSELKLQFVPGQTSPFNDRYAIAFNGTVDKTGWSSGPVNASGTVELQADQKPVSISLNGEIKTESLSMWRYWAKHIYECPVPELVTGVRLVLRDEDCKAARSFIKAESLQELAAAMVSHIANVKKSLRAYSAAAELSISANPYPTLRHQTEIELKKARSVLKSLEQSRLETRPDGSFSFRLSNADLGDVNYKELAYEVSAEKTRIRLTLQSKRGMGMYEAFKPEIESLLDALQNGEDWAQRHVILDLRATETFINSYINR